MFLKIVLCCTLSKPFKDEIKLKAQRYLNIHVNFKRLAPLLCVSWERLMKLLRYLLIDFILFKQPYHRLISLHKVRVRLATTRKKFGVERSGKDDDGTPISTCSLYMLFLNANCIMIH